MAEWAQRLRDGVATLRARYVRWRIARYERGRAKEVKRRFDQLGPQAQLNAYARVLAVDPHLRTMWRRALAMQDQPQTRIEIAKPEALTQMRPLGPPRKGPRIVQ